MYRRIHLKGIGLLFLVSAGLWYKLIVAEPSANHASIDVKSADHVEAKEKTRHI